MPPQLAAAAAAAAAWHPVLLRVAAALLCALAAAWLLRGRILDCLEAALSRATGQREKAARNSFLRGNFAPVRAERGPSPCAVASGALPAGLDGVFMRNGPDARVELSGDYHWFDGDGNVHCMRLRGGERGGAGSGSAPAIYSNRYVRTPRLELELAADRPLFTRIGDEIRMFGMLRVMLGTTRRLVRDRGLYPRINTATANTAIVFHPGSGLLALNEAATPTVLTLSDDGVMHTMGPPVWAEALPGPFTAHPRICPSTGELWAYGYGTNKSKLGGSLYRIAAIGPDGALRKTIHVHDIKQPVMVHDCALTSEHFVIMDHPLMFKPKLMSQPRSEGPGFPIRFDPSRPSRYGLLRRDAVDDSGIRWFEMPAHMVFHTVAAWEEGDVTVLHACVMASTDLLVAMRKVKDQSQRYADFYDDPATRPHHCVLLLDRKTGKATVRPVLGEDFIVDFPTSHPAFVGRRMRYAFLTRFRERGGLLVRGAVKVDLLERRLVGEFAFEDNESGGEMLFVPRDHGKTSSKNGDASDDGWLLTYVHDELTGENWFDVIDATSMQRACRLRVDHRVPYGMHTAYLSAAQLDAVRLATMRVEKS